MNNRFDAVIFDFDFTLADSSKGAIECINFAFGQMGFPKLPAEKICPTIGLSLPDTFAKLAGSECSSRSDEFARLFIHRANEVLVDLTALFDGVPETIKQLKHRGLLLGIVSTKYRRRIAAVLQRERLREFFDAVIGGEDVLNHKPAPDGLLKAVERLRCAPSRSLYVGDSVTDAETARQADVPFAAVLSGTTTRDDFADYDVHEVFETLSQLPDWLDN